MSEAENVSGPGAAPDETRPGPAAPPPKPEVNPRARRFSGFFAIAIVVLLLGAVSLTVLRLRTGSATESRLDELARDIAAINSNIDTLNTRVTETQSRGDRLADLATRLEALESDTISQLQGRITRLESRSPSEMLKAAAATLARANLARAAELATPFMPELEALRAVTPDDPALGLLQANAETGVPTRTALKARFAGVASASLDAARQEEGSGNFLTRFWASMRRLVSVRRVGDVAGLAAEDRLARAQAACDRDDLAGAVAEARGVSGKAAMPLESWLKDAQARLAVDRAVAGMNARIVQTLAAPATAAPAAAEP